ncbi:hypothetical protein GCM10011390_43760 [Aureimonas endophytica]|uniref:Flagellar FliJ protein n=1 Tax=Aureimonas endophytica TaxID=2027858 RepID=A0A916ZZN7_9HYPH|nr:hypothetical protein [Aureimonas endophytica]GGE19753.1 hypothetical protein GCM10011390_43760 [Aureimonas endophytica]
MSAERERANRLHRLLEVQARKRKLTEWRLAELAREGAELQATSAEILESLGTHSLLNGLFLEGRASALRRNEAKIVANRQSREETGRELVEAQRIEKRMARAVDDAETAALRREEREELELALDDYLAAGRASLE